MAVFEFHFNPKAKKDVVYESFAYEPESAEEEQLGSLYIVAELTNTLPQHSSLLRDLAEIIKREYYNPSPSEDPEHIREEKSGEENFNRALKKANKFLAEETKKGNVDWLGNLNFAVLGLNNLVLNFTKSGKIKILLLRPLTLFEQKIEDGEGEVEIMDIASNLEFQSASSQPARVFENIVTGKLAPGDKVVLLTREVFEFFKEYGLLKRMGLCSKKSELEKVLKSQKKLLLNISGICFFALLDSGQKGMLKISHIGSAYRQAGRAYRQAGRAYRQAGHPFTALCRKATDLAASLRRAGSAYRQAGRAYRQAGKMLQALPAGRQAKSGGRLPATRLRQMQAGLVAKKVRLVQILFSNQTKKLFILILALVLTLALGFFLFGKQGKQNKESLDSALERARFTVAEAENALIFKDEERAKTLFRQAWRDLTPLSSEDSSIGEEAKLLREEIGERINSLSQPAPKNKK